MPYDENDDEEIKKHGTLKHWLQYQVSVAGREITGWKILAAVCVVTAVVVAIL